MLDTAVEPLGAWEKWLVSKAKEDRLHLEKQADEASNS